uniref:SAM domain-containing protein n=1 Tax=Guillardia theta TaxID=55529 RepID=A0A7S4PD64_GUITH|mmetsp:Transcript_48380/g.151687  ORF Transcript_48380/g.151687 Transcript_48380/m.151687 type:complete len:470 (+) Transcript_48380:38-1447(+)
MQGEGSKLRERVFSKFADCNPSAMWKNTACRIESLSSALSKPYTSSPKTLSHETMRVSPQEWGVDEVCAWLQEEGLHEFVAIARDHIITGAVLLSIQEEDLRVDPLASALKEARVDKFGRVRQFVLSIRELVDQHRQTLNLLHDQPQDRRSKSATSAFVASLYKPEPLSSALLRLGCSLTWAAFVMMATASVMTFVHDRVPDMAKHPPLPDVVLDNIPVIPGAFEASEVCIILLASIFALTCIFHVHRLVILRRVFAITGSVFMLRCCTMLVTSLSVPGIHLKCRPFPEQMTIEDKIAHAWKIASTFGSTLQGTRTCGDYMFSGHTAMLTILNRFVCAYSPRTWTPLHTFSAVLNGFGMFCILAAHEHYTLDVFMGFYIATRTFQSYHTVAHADVSDNEGLASTRRWFPMVSFLEENCSGVVPFEYEIPFSRRLQSLLFKRANSAASPTSHARNPFNRSDSEERSYKEL